MPPLESSHYPAAASITIATSIQRPVSSNPSQAPPVPTAYGFPTTSNQESPQLPPNGPHGRPNSLERSVMIPPNVHYHHFPPPLGNNSVNGTVADAPSYPPHHDAPHSALLQSTNVEPSAHSTPHALYPTPVPAPSLRPPAYSEAPYLSHAHGMRRRKAPRALQVRQREREKERKRERDLCWWSSYAVANSSRLATDARQESRNVMKGDLHVATARKTICPAFTKTRCL